MANTMGYIWVIYTMGYIWINQRYALEPFEPYISETYDDIQSTQHLLSIRWCQARIQGRGDGGYIPSLVRFFFS